MSSWDRFLDSFFNLKVAAEYLPKIIDGFWLTVLLALCIVVTGLVAGLLLAVLRSFGVRPLNWLIIFAVDLFRALPPLVLITLLYFGLPAAGFSLTGFASTWLALSLVLMAFAEEIFWAGITPSRRASGRRRGPPASLSCRRCAWWCCPRRCA